ncbi:hypothetical protein [Desulfobacter postgatei]|uniref:ATP-grasp domain-containing protein n=1 Tax=Desulfobacter postgatei 2ac9 TaxID=879212 RepID=I5B267_9BACT|nr:hypothetical protein [Desulfobacter postgatei]EIM63580.1 hypothetical protein DespoDRAFT_01656 [Desulfobacter postgatei 2ac9]
MPEPKSDSAALVVGLTIQGLAVARALARKGVQVYAVDRSDKGPAAKSRYLTMFARQGVNPEDLPDTLIALRKHIPYHRVVLFPCSDKTVRAIAANWDKLSKNYLLSWADCTELTASFTYKSVVCRHAEKNGVAYPRARIIASLDDCKKAQEMQFPLIVKPDQPPAAFKTRKLTTLSQLYNLVKEFPDSLPFLAQECVEGEDDRLQFCAFFMDKGLPLADITGRKQRSFPKGLGRGTILELFEDDQVRQHALQFLKGLPLCGPVAVEFKRDNTGRLWLIEPTVGRTEYCVDVTVQGGLNLPYMEFCYTLRLAHETFAPVLSHNVVWYDTEKEPLCYLLACVRQRTLSPWGKNPYFPYYGHNDIHPLLSAFNNLMLQTFKKGYPWIIKRLKFKTKQ